MPELRTWRTITLGSIGQQELAAAGIQMTESARELLERCENETCTEATIDLVRLSAVDLGLDAGTTYEDILFLRIELGLQLCPIGAVPPTCIDYQDQPIGESLYFVMEPTEVPLFECDPRCSIPSILCLACSDIHWQADGPGAMVAVRGHSTRCLLTCPIGLQDEAHYKDGDQFVFCKSDD